jgi:hypothetical protein
MSRKAMSRAISLNKPAKGRRRKLEEARGLVSPSGGTQYVRGQGIAGARPAGPGAAGIGGAQASAPGGGKRNLSQGFQAGLGRQLSSRVSSGAISQEQAEGVAKDRAALKRHYGESWRKRLYGDTDIVDLRRKLKAEPTNPELTSLYDKLMAKRRRLIEGAYAQS